MVVLLRGRGGASDADDEDEVPTRSPFSAPNRYPTPAATAANNVAPPTAAAY